MTSYNYTQENGSLVSRRMGRCRTDQGLRGNVTRATQTCVCVCACMHRPHGDRGYCHKYCGDMPTRYYFKKCQNCSCIFFFNFVAHSLPDSGKPLQAVHICVCPSVHKEPNCVSSCVSSCVPVTMAHCVIHVLYGMYFSVVFKSSLDFSVIILLI